MKLDNKGNPIVINHKVLPRGESIMADGVWEKVKDSSLVKRMIERGLLVATPEAKEAPKREPEAKTDAPVVEEEEQRIEAFRTVDMSAKDAKEWLLEQDDQSVMEAAIEGEERSSVLRVFEERLQQLLD